MIWVVSDDGFFYQSYLSIYLLLYVGEEHHDVTYFYYTTSCLSVVGVTSLGRIALLEYRKYNIPSQYEIAYSGDTSRA